MSESIATKNQNVTKDVTKEKEILALLKEDASMTTAEMAQKLSVHCILHLPPSFNETLVSVNINVLSFPSVLIEKLGKECYYILRDQVYIA